jgi:hypothetical protein
LPQRRTQQERGAAYWLRHLRQSLNIEKRQIFSPELFILAEQALIIVK